MFVGIDDIHDAILEVTTDDIAEANMFVIDAGIRLGVSEEDMITPPRFITRRLAVVFACYLAALRSVGSDGTAVFDGRDNADIYAQKLSYYQKEVRSIESRLTAGDFTDKQTAGIKTIELGRG